MLSVLSLTHGGKLTVKDALDAVNPWAAPEWTPPTKEQLIAKVKAFNAGLAKSRK